MDLKSNVEFVFTAACIREKSHDRWRHSVSRTTQCCLLFGPRTGDLDLHNRDYHKDIAESEITRRYLGTNFIILPHASNTDGSTFLIATNSVDKACRVALDYAKNLPVTLVKDGVVEYTDGLTVRDACGLPDKFVVGCEGCPSTSDLPNVCALVRLMDLPTIPEFNVDNFVETVTYWKTSIGRFRAIGPSLTSQMAIGDGARPINEHSFNRVDPNYALRQKGTKERTRRQAYLKVVCPQCSMREPCLSEGVNVRCRGYYGALNNLAGEIIRKVYNPFTESQMRTLLHNSGLFQKYYKRHKCFATLRVANSELQFVLIRKTDPNGIFVATGNYKEAVSWIKKYHGDPSFPSGLSRFKKQEKAAFLELASRSGSPRYFNGWRTISYPLWYITQDSNGDFVTTYAWAHGRATLPWKVRIRSLEDVYKNFQSFRYVNKVHHPLCYRTRYGDY